MQELIPIVPPRKNRKLPWQYGTKLYKRRNEVECFFFRIKRFAKFLFTMTKLDKIFIAKKLKYKYM